MNARTKKINTKLTKLGQTLGLDKTDTLRAKRTTKNIVTLALFTGAFMLLGHLMMPSGPVGLYYTGVSTKDFQILFGGFF
jgi:hypothetical protein